jgi:ankyrin repeat protein
LYNDHGQAPLTGATDKGDAAMVELLLEHGAHVEGAMPGTRTALMMAAMFNRCDVVDLLLTRGANPDARDGGGLSVLEAAHIMGAPDTPSQLMKARQQL